MFTVRRKKLLLAGLFSCPVVIGAICMSGCALYRQFGDNPKEGYLEEVQSSPHYIGGKFQNLEPTPMFTDGSGPLGAIMEVMFAADTRAVPASPLPFVKIDFKALPPDKDLVIWLGHSSFYLQLGGYRILIDPIFSGHASPLSLINRAFEGTNRYSAGDFPEIDYLLISHDHWDHMDYHTAIAMNPLVKNVVCGLGVGSHYRYWGYDAARVHEGDWYTAFRVSDNLTIHVLPARHRSGRSGGAGLWVSFAIVSPERRVFFSGDSGYGKHYAEIGARLGGFDLVMLDSGQYNDKWRYAHMIPEEAAQAAEELRSRWLLPAHVGRFRLATHAWDEPFSRATEASRGKAYRLITPVIGEVVALDAGEQKFSRWWETLE